jgi:hypothetical protein
VPGVLGELRQGAAELRPAETFPDVEVPTTPAGRSG